MKNAPFLPLGETFCLRQSAVPVVAVLLGACMKFSPFETELEAHERGQTQKNLDLLAAQPAPSGAWRFAVISDSHQNYDALGDVVTELNARDFAFVLHAGDLTDLGLKQEFRWMLEQLRELDMPCFTVIGNHDAISNGQSIYADMFGAYDYTFSFGGYRFVGFNSNWLEFGPSVPDLGWLAEATSPPSGEPVITFSHRPRDDHDPEGDGYDGVLKKSGVRAAFAGHLHKFRLEQVRPFLSVLVPTTLDRSWVEVGVDGSTLTVDECSSAGCVRRAP